MNKARFFVVLFLLAGISTGSAYDPVTHSHLSGIATEQSELNPNFGSVLQDLGLSSYNAGVYSASQTSLGGQSLGSLIRLGAMEEDSPAVRALAHFFDPQYNNFQGAPLLIGEETFGAPSLIGQNTSPDWAIEDNGERTVSYSGVGSDTQEYSYYEAKRYFRSAMTATSPATRLSNAGLMFESLGHIIHHVQDMAQPQHTRNDPHLPFGVLLGIQPYDAARYEKFTLSEYPLELDVKNLLSGAATAPYQVSAPAFPTIRHYWSTPGTTTDTRVGMAEFSSQNFVSEGSLVRAGSWPASIGNFSSPSQLYVPYPDGSTMSIATRPVNVKYKDNSSIVGNVDFVVGDVRDDYVSRNYDNIELAATSLLTRHVSGLPYRVVSINRENFKAMQSVLLPRATAFSTGVINHFFRGRLGLRRTPDERNLWEISNNTSETMSGTFSIYFDNHNGQRALYASAAATLASGQTFDITSPEPPETSTLVIATFEGSLGTEQNFPGGLAAAKVTAYTPPPDPTIPCGDVLTASGSSEGLVAVYDLGTESGEVPVEFEAYNIPDGLTISARGGSNQTVFDTNGLVSGFRFETFDYNFANFGTSELDVVVTGNTNTNTAWWLVVGCPGANPVIDPADRPEPFRTVTWTFAKDGPSGVSCNFDFYVDGQFVKKVFGNATFNSSLSVGRHELTYVNKSCSAGNSAAYTATYRDPTGTYPVKSPIFGNSWIFHVH